MNFRTAFGIALVLLSTALVALLRAQESYFSQDPLWASTLTQSTLCLAWGDVDGDGDLDLVCGNPIQNCCLYENRNGQLSSMPAWYSATSYYLNSIALGDIDGDGDLDLVCGNGSLAVMYPEQPCTAYENTGNWFSSDPVWASDSAYRMTSIVLGDVDNDGDLDLVCACRDSIIVFENTGTGLATAPLPMSLPAQGVRSIALGDVDGDGYLDLVCGTTRENTLHLNAGGEFDPEPAWISVPAEYTWSVALGDVNGDGLLDLACGNLSTLSLYENSDTLFTANPVWIPAENPDIHNLRGVCLGDVDSDGDLDLVCASYNVAHTALFENTGSGFSSDPSWILDFTYRTTSIALGDVDNDGDLDLALGNESQSNLVLESTTAPLSRAPVWSSGPANRTVTIDLGDVNKDGRLDLVCGNYCATNCGYQPNTLYFNAGKWPSTEPAWEAGRADYTLSVMLGDYDGDGDLDLACGNDTYSFAPGPNRIYDNIGGMFSTDAVWVSNMPFDSYGIASGDIDNDGDLDLLFGDHLSRVELYINLGGVMAVDPVYIGLPDATFDIALCDLDGDGDLDLVCGISGPNKAYENIGGSFADDPVWQSSHNTSTWAVACGDVDGDGDFDLVCGNVDQANTMYENMHGILTTEAVWSSSPVYDTYDVALGDIDGDGDLDLVCGNGDPNNPQPNTLYKNTGTSFTRNPAWYSDSLENTQAVALADIDRDGDLDLVCGNDGEPNTIYEGLKNPAYRGDPLAPTRQLSNNGAFISDAVVSKLNDNHYRVRFTLIDLESDRVWIVGEYQFEGSAVWHPIELSTGGNRYGPVTASPAGVTDSLEWNTTRVPFDRRNVIVRLRTVEIPGRSSIIQHAATYVLPAGTILPLRSELTASPNSLLFSQSAVTVGDTASMYLVLSNTGTLDLTIDRIELPSVEMRAEYSSPMVLTPGQRDTIVVFLEPRFETDIAGSITISSNDLINPVRSIPVVTDIRPLGITSKLLKSSDEIPLGEAATVVITPAPQVRVETGFLYHRHYGAAVFADSIPLSPFESDFVALIPGEAVTEGGIEYFIRVENSGVYGTHPPGAPHDSVLFQPVRDPSSIAVTGYGTPVENSDVPLLIDLPQGAVFSDGSVYYRRGGEQAYQVTSIGNEEDNLIATIPDSAVGYRGVEFWAEVHTLTRTLTFPAADPAQHPAGFSVIVRNLTEPYGHPGGTQQTAYRMISIPIVFSLPYEGSIETMLADQPEFGSYDPVHWRLWRFEPSTSSYAELSDETADAFRPAPGSAFWLICANSHRIDTAPIAGLSQPTANPFTIFLEPGRWNMIGDPYAFPISWDSVLVDSLPLTDAIGMLIDPPVRWNGAYRADCVTLDPFEGYWIYNRSNRRLAMLVPPREAVQETPATNTSAVTARSDRAVSGEWRCNISVKADGMSDTFNAFGFSPGCTRSLDRDDRLDPPPPPGGMSLYFVNGAGGDRPLHYAVDMRAAPSPGASEWGETWAFDILKDRSKEAAGDEVSIVMNGVETLPLDSKAVLLDRELDRQVPLEADAAYSFFLGARPSVADEEDARFRIIIGTEQFVENESSRLLDLPTKAALYQNYPNPFNPMTIIRYDLAKAGRVKLSVYDVSGALIKVLENRDRDPGRYEVGWNGENKRGERVSSGVYFYVLETPETRIAKKMLCVK